MLVVRVVDGDTVEVQFDDGSSTTIGILGVATPPMEASPRDSVSTRCFAAWGQRAARYTTEALEGDTVFIILDPSNNEAGSEFMVYIRAMSGDFGADLVEEGFARVTTQGESRRLADYARLEEPAKDAGLGLWEC